MSLCDVLRVVPIIFDEVMGDADLRKPLFTEGDDVRGLDVDWELNGACALEADRLVAMRAGRDHIVAEAFLDVAKFDNGKYENVPNNRWQVTNAGLNMLGSTLHPEFYAQRDLGGVSGRLPHHWVMVPWWSKMVLRYDTSLLSSKYGVPEKVVLKIANHPWYLRIPREDAVQHYLNHEEEVSTEVSVDCLKNLLSGLDSEAAVLQARTVCIGTVRRVPWALSCCCNGVRTVMRDHRPPRIHLIPCPGGGPAFAVPMNDVRVVWQSGEPVTRWGVFCDKNWDFVKLNADADEDSLVRMVTSLWDGKDCSLFFMGCLEFTGFSDTEPTDTLGYVRSLDYRWSPSPITLRHRASTMIKVTDQAAYDRHFAGIKRQ